MRSLKQLCSPCLKSPQCKATRRSPQHVLLHAPPLRSRRSAQRTCAIFLPSYNATAPPCLSSGGVAAEICPTRRSPFWDRVLDVPASGLWCVPWRAQTIVLVMMLWSTAYLLTGRGLSSVLLAGGLSNAALGDRALALYSFALDTLQCIATALVLRASLAFYGPLSPGWFALNVRSAARHWRLFLGACSTFPLLSAVTAFAYDSMGGAVAPVFWQGASFAALHAGACDGVALCIYVASYALLAPLWEEAVFRGFLLPSLCRYLPAHTAVCVSAVIFAGAHCSASAPGLLLLGVLLGGTYVRTRSLAAPILLHGLWNLHTVAGMLLS